MTTITKMLRQQQERMAASSDMVGKKSCRYWGLILLVLCCMIVSVMPCVTAADSLTRGSMFTVSIAAKPGTAYYVWFTRTFAMSGEPGDQPPLIVGNTVRVEFDPAGGPYVIGSYQFRNGNGRTILDDVAPSSATVPNTQYYAKVTTDENGVGIVQFTTSSATADRTFSVRAENPASPGEEVPVRLGLPEKKTTTVTAAAPKGTTKPLPLVTVPPLAEPAATTPPEPATTLPEPAAPQGTTAVPTTLQQTPVELPMIVAAAGAGLFAVRRYR
jgi:hypothetical protein